MRLKSKKLDKFTWHAAQYDRGPGAALSIFHFLGEVEVGGGAI